MNKPTKFVDHPYYQNIIKDYDFMMQLFRLIHRAELNEDIYISVEDSKPKFAFNINDVFIWGAADAEPITSGNIDILEKAIYDLEHADDKYGTIYAPMLFAARIRKMRPQNCVYDEIPETCHKLFDECGPKRNADLGNGISKKYPSRN